MSERWRAWAKRAAVAVQFLIICAGWIVGVALCALALGQAGSQPFLPLMLLLLLGFAAVIVHEAGHYLAARSAGMTVLLMGIGRVELRPQGGRWRVRWAQRTRYRAAGFVIAVDDPSRPIRAQRLRMIAGGPGANLVVAVIAGALAFFWLPHEAAWLMLAFAFLNACIGLANLVPDARGPGSDGLHLWFWRHPEREFGAEFAHARLLALTVSGVTADQLPQEQLAILEGQPAPMPLVALWYRLKAHQNRGEWHQAAAARAGFEQLSQALPRELQQRLGDLLACIRAELAFSQALQDADHRHLADDLLPRQVDWSEPTLRPRYLALRALLNGSRLGALALLDQAQRLASQSPDKALAPSEAMIRGGMLARLTDTSASLPGPPG